MHKTEALAECHSTSNPSTGSGGWGREDNDFKASLGYIETKSNQTKPAKGSPLSLRISFSIINVCLRLMHFVSW